MFQIQNCKPKKNHYITIHSTHMCVSQCSFSAKTTLTKDMNLDHFTSLHISVRYHDEFAIILLYMGIDNKPTHRQRLAVPFNDSALLT